MFESSDRDYHIEYDSPIEGSDSSEDEIHTYLHGTPKEKRRLRRRSLGQPSSSEDEFDVEMEKQLNVTVEGIEKQRKQIMDASDSETEGSRPSTSATRPSKSSRSRPSTSAATPPKSSQKLPADVDMDSDGEGDDVKLPQPSNDELLYDPDEDDGNQRWVDEQRRQHRNITRPRSTGTKPAKAPSSDAVLDCPACMTTLCIDCQRHDSFKTQYRAMFVMNCSVDQTEVLKYPEAKQNKNRGRRKRSQQTEAEPPAGGNGATDIVYHPVHCTECQTEVGVYDTDEIYHFFNVLASYS